jgi:hypothetical protein
VRSKERESENCKTVFISTCIPVKADWLCSKCKENTDLRRFPPAVNKWTEVQGQDEPFKDSWTRKCLERIDCDEGDVRRTDYKG